MSHPEFKKNPPRPAFRAVLALSAAVTAAVYIPALMNGFVNWDDPDYVYANRFIRSIDFHFLRYAFVGPAVSNWHPLTVISYALDYKVWGLNPFGYHLTNVVLHALNTWLVGLLALKLFSYGKKADLLPMLAAGITALLFGLHPLHVESVAWISERKDVLCAFFYILSLLAYLRYAETEKGASVYYCLTLVLFGLALMSKPMAITLPFVLLILDFYPLKRPGSVKALVEKVPFFAMSAASGVLTLWAQARGGALANTAVYPLDERVTGAVRSVVFYIHQTLAPLDLSPYYPWYPRSGFFGAEFLVSLLAVVLITALSVMAARRNRIFLAVWLYFIVTLGPVLGLVQAGGQAAADRYMYLPSIGPFLLAGAAIAELFLKYRETSHRVVIVVSLFVIMAFLANETISQEGIWKDSATLWSSEIDNFPGRVNIAYDLRGLAYEEIGDHRRAIDDYTEAIKLRPYSLYVSPYNNRGISYEAEGEYAKALRDYSTAITLNPALPEPYMNRGRLYEKFGEYRKAMADYNRARELKDNAP